MQHDLFDTMSSWVTIAERYRRSAMLEVDARADDALSGYVVSPLGHRIAHRVFSSAAEERGQRAFTLVGPYGTGKSSLLTWLARLCVADGRAQALDVAGPERSGPLAEPLGRLGALEPVLVTGRRAPIASALLDSAIDAAERFWSGRGGRPRVFDELYGLDHERSDGAPLDSARVVGAILSLADQIESSSRVGSGVCVMLDELGKFLEHAALNPQDAGSDVYALQLLAEAAQRSGPGRVVVLTTLHQELAAYARGLPRRTQAEWSKIAGRFETVAFLEPPMHLVSLVREAIGFDPGAEDGGEWAEALASLVDSAAEESRALTELSSALGGDDARALAGCAPLAPSAAACVGPLFRTRFGQNERSLFAFLASREPGGFRSFLEGTPKSKARAFALHDLYDYVAASSGIRAATDAIDRTWAACAQAIARLPAGAERLDEVLLKHIALLSIAGAPAGLRASGDVLCATTSAAAPAVDAALERLKEAGAVVHRDFKGAWAIWDGSDLDVASLVAERRLKVRARGGLSKALAAAFPAHPIVASRHFMETGTLRHLTITYADASSSPLSSKAASVGDGELLCVIPDDLGALEDIRVALAAGEEPSLGAHCRPRAVALPGDPELVLERALDFFAVRDALASTPELAGDPVARRELEGREVQARARLADAIASAYTASTGNPEWYFGGRRVPDTSRPGSAASAIFDEAYGQAPVIKNELINRRALSSHTAAAQRVLMERMITHGDQQRLGIEGHPPELSLYRSLFESEGLHAERGDGTWAFTDPPEGSSFAPVWSALDGAFEGGERVGVSSALDLLARPPLGLRDGVAPVLVLAYVLTRIDEVFLYEDNTFLPSVGPDAAQRLLKRPKTFEIQAAASDPALESARGELAVRLGGAASATTMQVARHVVSRYSRLSRHAKQTARVSPSARKARSTIASARDPVRLLFEDLPGALGTPLGAEGGPGAYASALADALEELEGADSALLGDVSRAISDHFFPIGGHRPQSGEGVLSSLGARARAIAGAEWIPSRVARLINVAPEFADPGEGAREGLSALGTAVIGKPPSSWTDEDARRFSFLARELGQDFLACEDAAGQSPHAQSPLEDGGPRHEPWRVTLKSPVGREWHALALGAIEADKAERLRSGLSALARELGVSERDIALHLIQSTLADPAEGAEQVGQPHQHEEYQG